MTRPPAQLSDSFSPKLTQQKTWDLDLCSLSHSYFSPAGPSIQVSSPTEHLGTVLAEGLFTTLWVHTVIPLTFSDATLKVWWLCLAAARGENEILTITPVEQQNNIFVYIAIEKYMSCLKIKPNVFLRVQIYSRRLTAKFNTEL